MTVIRPPLTRGRPQLVSAAFLTVLLLAECWWLAAHGGNWAFTLVTGMVAGGLAVVWDRNPAAAAARVIAVCAVAAVASVLMHGPSQPGVAATSALFFIGAASIRVAGARGTAAVATAGALVLVIGRVDAPPAHAWATAVLGVLGWLTALGIGGWLRVADARRRVALEAARREERLDLARELHDVVAHHVAAIVVQAQATRLVCTDGSAPPLGQLAAIEAAGVDALGAMRRVIGLLRDEDAVTVASPERVADLVQRFAELGPPVAVDGELDPALPQPVAGTVYRIVQEALTNVRLHAPTATRVDVTMTRRPGAVTVSVSDDALAARPAPNGHGLVGMRERVEALGGTFHTGPQPPAGWAVTAVIPLPDGP